MRRDKKLALNLDKKELKTLSLDEKVIPSRLTNEIGGALADDIGHAVADNNRTTIWPTMFTDPGGEP